MSFRRLEHVMGMPIAITTAGRAPRGALDAAFSVLRRADAVFSPFKPDSDISRLDRGERLIADCAPEVDEVLERCRELTDLTHGFFTVRPRGRLDPCGLVKGWAVARAARELRARGIRHALLDAGGDVYAMGSGAGGEPWRVGIRHPVDPEALAAVVVGRDLAVATSGEYERGAHIVDPRTGGRPTGLLSVTVVGGDLPTADAYATAIFAMGEAGPAWAARQPGVEVLCITTDERVLTTAGMTRHLLRSTDRAPTAV